MRYKLLFILILILFCLASVSAENIISQPQNIKVSGYYILNNDLYTPKILETAQISSPIIIISTGNVVLDCQNHTIENIYSGHFANFDESNPEPIKAETGIAIMSNNSVTIKNCIIKNFYYGILVNNSNSTILTSNSLLENRVGIKVLSSFDTQIINNFLKDNVIVAQDSNKDTIYKQNIYLNNLFSFQESFSAREVSINTLIEGNISILYPNGNPITNFTENIRIYPNEPIEKRIIGNSINLKFRPNSVGLYTLVISITDKNNNTLTRQYSFFVNPKQRIIRYYLTNSVVSKGYGQPLGNGHDVGSLSLLRPTGERIIWCQIWVQASPKDLATNIPVLIKRISPNFWYYTEQLSRCIGYAGIEEDVIYGIRIIAPRHICSPMDYNITIPETGEFKWTSANFTVDWPVDYLNEWYRLSLKVSHPTSAGLNGIEVKTNSTNPSYIDVVYDYTNTPEILNLSNIEIISATSKESDSSSIYFTSQKQASLIIKITEYNPDQDYTVFLNGNRCNTPSFCSFKQIGNIFSIAIPNPQNVSLLVIKPEKQKTFINYIFSFVSYAIKSFS